MSEAPEDSTPLNEAMLDVFDMYYLFLVFKTWYLEKKSSKFKFSLNLILNFALNIR